MEDIQTQRESKKTLVQVNLQYVKNIIHSMYIAIQQLQTSLFILLRFNRKITNKKISALKVNYFRALHNSRSNVASLNFEVFYQKLL